MTDGGVPCSRPRNNDPAKQGMASELKVYYSYASISRARLFLTAGQLAASPASGRARSPRADQGSRATTSAPVPTTSEYGTRSALPRRQSQQVYVLIDTVLAEINSIYSHCMDRMNWRISVGRSSSRGLRPRRRLDRGRPGWVRRAAPPSLGPRIRGSASRRPRGLPLSPPCPVKDVFGGGGAVADGGRSPAQVPGGWGCQGRGRKPSKPHGIASPAGAPT